MLKDHLENLLESLLIMSGVDGLHPSELKVIVNFMDDYWTGSQEELQEFIKDGVKRLSGISSKEQRFEEVVQKMAKLITAEEKQQVIKLVEKLIMADNIFSHLERALYMKMKQAFA